MTCREVAERLSEFWSGELSPTDSYALTEHLRQCAACRREWATFQGAMHALQSAFVPEASADLPQRISAAVRAKVASHRALAWRRWGVVAVGAVAALFLCFAPFRLLPTRRQEAPIIAEQPTPPATMPAPALKLPPLPEKGQKPTPPALKPQLPPPSERLKKVPKHLPLSESPPAKSLAPVLTERPQPPTVEAIPQETPKEWTESLKAPPEEEMPRMAQLPSQPRTVPFTAEAQLSEQARRQKALSEIPAAPTLPGAGTRATRAPQGGLGGFGGRSGVGDWGSGFGQLGGGQLALPAIIFVPLRWGRFEPVVVGKVQLWEFALTVKQPQTITVTIQPADGVDILNAQAETPVKAEKLLWQDRVLPGRDIRIPLLLRASEVGVKRLRLVVRTQDGHSQMSEWWIIFAATEREEPPQWQRSLTLQRDQWTLLDLATHLAWETKAPFLLPAAWAMEKVSVPTGTVETVTLLSVLERQIGGQWGRTGSAFHLLPSHTPAAPVLKQ